MENELKCTHVTAIPWHNRNVALPDQCRNFRREGENSDPALAPSLSTPSC